MQDIANEAARDTAVRRAFPLVWIAAAAALLILGFTVVPAPPQSLRGACPGLRQYAVRAGAAAAGHRGRSGYG